jgi:hypothetical protein
VIPAHNESAGITRCLDTLLDDAGPEEFDVIVVANGCVDSTAERARATRFSVRVLETPVAGKASAIRLGDAACTTFPRLYMDADVELRTGDVRALVAALQTPGVLAAAPTPRLEMTGVSVIVRGFLRVYSEVMQSRRALSGVGAYALTQAGHERVFPIPDILADDQWVERSFDPGEKVVVLHATTVVRPACTFRAIVRQSVRIREGNQQLDRRGKTASGGQLGLRTLWSAVFARRVRVLDVACYLLVVIADRGLSRLRRLRAAEPSWYTDRTSRAPSGRK